MPKQGLTTHIVLICAPYGFNAARLTGSRLSAGIAEQSSTGARFRPSCVADRPEVLAACKLNTASKKAARNKEAVQPVPAGGGQRKPRWVGSGEIEGERRWSIRRAPIATTRCRQLDSLISIASRLANARRRRS